MKRALPLLVLALAVGLVACKPTPNPPSPPQGFDTCAAPSLNTMKTWWDNSPFTSVGIYVGGANRGCAQPNLSSSWITTALQQGWALIPIWVGPQAPCSSLSSTKFPSNTTDAFNAGVNEGNAAATRMRSFGFGWLAPAYYDMEAYPRSTSCTAAVQSFTNGWTKALNANGYVAGFYSSQCSGIVDVAAIYNTAQYRLQGVWIAAWNGNSSVFGFGSGGCAVPDSYWPNHQRLHQFQGGHNETWGGLTINIDSNGVDGYTYHS
jgi:Domain of unknown function (DUF1906)